MFAFVFDEVVLGAAEDTFRFDFLEDDAVFVDEDLDLVVGGDAENAAEFHRDDDAAEVIQFSNNAS